MELPFGRLPVGGGEALHGEVHLGIDGEIIYQRMCFTA